MSTNKRHLLAKRLDICSVLMGAVGIALTMVGLLLPWGWIKTREYYGTYSREILLSVNGIQTSERFLVVIGCIIAVCGFFLILTKVLKIGAALLGPGGVCIVFAICNWIGGGGYVQYERYMVSQPVEFSFGAPTTLIGGLMIITAAALSVIHARLVMAEEKQT